MDAGKFLRNKALGLWRVEVCCEKRSFNVLRIRVWFIFTMLSLSAKSESRWFGYYLEGVLGVLWTEGAIKSEIQPASCLWFAVLPGKYKHSAIRLAL